MSTETTFDQLVLANIAAIFNAQLSNFTFYTAMPNLPETEEDWAQLLDLVPQAEIFHSAPGSTYYFSQVYGQILKAQIKQPIAIQIGNNNYNNAHNWLVPFTIPKYVPTLASAEAAIQQASQTKITLSCHQQNTVVPPYPEFPEIVASSPLIGFYHAVAQNNFTITVVFDQSASLPIQVGAWYNSAAFLYAYQTPNNWNTSIVSWDEVFNPDTGILRDINIAVAIVSDLTLTMQIAGTYDQATIDALEQIPQQVLFPFYQQIQTSSPVYTLESDNSLSIKLEVPKSNEYYLFGIQYQNVRNLFS